ncbi:hypothetical protein V9T40_004786 [Parthenolecanium corni]|uniref:Uncharacterized protein n=1 Tax=Parthenolecanium corni TaxID=536013 RepID=A0AAN9TGX5_9HEMI
MRCRRPFVVFSAPARRLPSHLHNFAGTGVLPVQLRCSLLHLSIGSLFFSILIGRALHVRPLGGGAFATSPNGVLQYIIINFYIVSNVP